VRVFRDGAGDVLLFGSDNPVYDAIYTTARPFDGQLREARGADGPARRAYLQVPRIDPAVLRLADSLTAGRETRIDQVRAVEAWLQSEFRYTLDLPRTRQDATLEGFLFRRRAGHCEYFSTAMAVLLRAKGIPTRNVNGFLGGEWNQNGRYLAVTGNNAHSWVEVWFPEWGWVTFDPTPPADRATVVEGGTGTWAWPALFWLDGVEYRWYKWVVDYNLERQLAVFRGVAQAFGRGDDEGPYGGESGEDGRGPLAPWALGAIGIVLLAWMATRRRGDGLPPEARAYLGLRRAYARAGYAAADEDGPLAFAETLARASAPGADAAGRAVELYVTARFSGRPADDGVRRALEEHAAEARGELRRAKRARSRV
jgi:transglutaminase-like putative cysteine protease